MTTKALYGVKKETSEPYANSDGIPKNSDGPYNTPFLMTDSSPNLMTDSNPNYLGRGGFEYFSGQDVTLGRHSGKTQEEAGTTMVEWAVRIGIGVLVLTVFAFVAWGLINGDWEPPDIFGIFD